MSQSVSKLFSVSAHLDSRIAVQVPLTRSINAIPVLNYSVLERLDLGHAWPTFPEAAATRRYAGRTTEEGEEGRDGIGDEQEPEEGGRGLQFVAAL